MGWEEGSRFSNFELYDFQERRGRDAIGSLSKRETKTGSGGGILKKVNRVNRNQPRLSSGNNGIFKGPLG